MADEQIKQFMCNENTSIMDAMELIDVNRSGTLFVVNNNGVLLGAITDGDIRRWIIKSGDLDKSVILIMNSKPKFLFEGQENESKILMKENQIRVVPVVNSKMQILRVIRYTDAMPCELNGVSDLLYDIPVVIMAGGEGTRLHPYTKILPKPLIPIGDTPIVERIINRFAECGIGKFYMTVNYKKGMIKNYFDDLNPNYIIEYVEENKPLGTAGSIKLIKERFNKPLFVVNCDTLIITNYYSLYQHHMETGNMITIVSALKRTTLPYGVVKLRSDGLIKCVEEKPEISNFVNTGLYVIDPIIIDYIPDNKKYHMTDLIESVIVNGGKVGMFPISEDSFLDMGEFGEMQRMEEKLNIVSN